MLPTRLELNQEMRRIRRSLAKQLTTCENTFPLFVLDLAGSANAPMDFSENSGRIFNMRKGIALTMGFLGGFSTLSTMNCEAVDMVTEGHRGEAAAYLVVTYGSTLGAAALGFALAHAILGS